MERTVVDVYEDIAFRLVMVDEVDTVDIPGVRTFLREFEELTQSYPYFPEVIARLNASLDAIEGGDARSGHDEDVLRILEVLRGALRETEGVADGDEITLSPPSIERLRAILSDAEGTGTEAEEPSPASESDLSELEHTAASDMFQLFASEAEHKLLDAQDVILELESHFDREKVNHVFRVFHTLKGECGFINLEKIGTLTHTVESLLDAVKKDSIPYGAEITDVLLRSIDEIRTLIDLLRQNDLVSYIRHDTAALAEELNGIIHRAYPPLGQILYDK
ncbi:MAG: Hpt domain-containing protein, partial [Spirochaetales bacterium]|nr:Hpt domain-containing protein [Spirochaetales bacterium]